MLYVYFGNMYYWMKYFEYPKYDVEIIYSRFLGV